MTSGERGGRSLVEQDVITDLVRRYADRGSWPGSELLLSPDDAVAFSKEAEALGVAATGVDVWHHLADGDAIAEDPGAGRYVPDEILAATFAVPASHAIVRDYIKRWLPESASRVYVGLQVPNEWLARPRT